ncbi:MAG: DMT family transporter [Gammaproteobacteria bacterium]|nr:DMT family transporter [Gammaproteobacteria bacterium]
MATLARPNVSFLLPPLAATVASIFFGASVVATRFVIDQTTPEVLAFLRYLIGAACLLPVFLAPGRKRILLTDVPGIILLGIAFFGLFPWTFSAALQYVPAAHGAIILATMPILTLGLAWVSGYEQISRNKLIAVGLTLSGVWLALGGKGEFGSNYNTVGYLLMFATSCLGALYNVFSKPYLKRIPSAQFTGFAMIAGVVFLLPGAALDISSTGWPEFTAPGWACVIFIGTLAGGIGFLLWTWALQRTSPTRVAVFVTLNPIAATALGAILLGEPVTLGFLIGLGCVVAGIILANYPSRTVTKRIAS